MNEFKIQNSELRILYPSSSHSNQMGCSALYHVSTFRMSAFLSGGRTESSTRSKSISMRSFGRYSMASEAQGLELVADPARVGDLDRPVAVVLAGVEAVEQR